MLYARVRSGTPGPQNRKAVLACRVSSNLKATAPPNTRRTCEKVVEMGKFVEQVRQHQRARSSPELFAKCVKGKEGKLMKTENEIAKRYGFNSNEKTHLKGARESWHNCWIKVHYLRNTTKKAGKAEAKISTFSQSKKWNIMLGSNTLPYHRASSLPLFSLPSFCSQHTPSFYFGANWIFLSEK